MRKTISWLRIHFLVLVLGLSFACSQTVHATDTTLLSLHLDEGTGISVTDSSGSGNNGIITGAVWISGITGNGLSFSGPSTNNKVDLGTANATLGQLGNTFTISAWIKTPTPNTRMTIYSSGNTGKSVLFGVSANGGLEAYYPSVFVASTAGGLLTPNTWYHVVYVKNGPGATNAFYINGVSKTMALNSVNNYVDSNSSRYIGYRSSLVFNGVIDEVQVYNRALSGGEVQESYNNPGL